MPRTPVKDGPDEDDARRRGAVPHDGAAPRRRGRAAAGPLRQRPAKALRVMIVDEGMRDLGELQLALEGAGHCVAARISGCADLLLAVARHKPDVILIDVDAPSRDTLESIGQINRDRPRPVVLSALQSDPDTIRRSIAAGVSAYVVDGLQPTRLKSLLEVAIVHFEEHQALKQELRKTRAQLADRCDVDRAKLMLMERRGLDEQQAFELLRKIAMDRKIRIGDAARAVIDIGQIL